MDIEHNASRRSFLKQVGAASLLTTGFGHEALSSGRTKLSRSRVTDLSDLPNILWLSCEDMSPRIGPYGDSLAETPNLDRLAREGMRFPNAFATAGVCAPSRTAIITGMYQTSIGAHHMRTSHPARWSIEAPYPYRTVPPPYVKAVPEYLRAAGYYTTNNAKTDYQFASSRDHGQPISAWNESSSNAHWKNRPDEDQPFFAVFNTGVTHESNIWPERYEGQELSTNPADVTVPPYYPDTPVVRQDLARHYDNISAMDEWVGEHLRELEEAGLAEDTLVVFWSDHGDGLPRAKEWLYDSGIHVPLIVRWPGHVQPNTVNENLVSLIDLGPTMLSAASLDPPSHMQGRSFLGADTGRPPREYVFAARDRMDEVYDMVRAVRDERYKYIRNYYPLKPYVQWRPYMNRMPTKQEMLRLKAEDKLKGVEKLWWRERRPPEELYDLREDPDEVNNLAGDRAYASELDRLRDVLDRWQRDTADMGSIPETQMKRQMWPDGDQPETADPLFIPNAPSHPTLEPAPGQAEYAAPTEMMIYCPTQGASMVYTTDSGKSPDWQLYTGPIRLPIGTTTLRAKAVRYGYEVSTEAVGTYTITES